MHSPYAADNCLGLCILQIREMEDVVRQSQTYASTLQNYNTSLQADVQVGSSSIQLPAVCQVGKAAARLLDPELQLLRPTANEQHR